MILIPPDIAVVIAGHGSRDPEGVAHAVADITARGLDALAAG